MSTFAGTVYFTGSDDAHPLVEADAGDDIVIADFEGDTYGDWTAEGEAFGRAPAKGTLTGQRNVAGYVDAGLANSYTGGGDGVGKLTSPAFKLERSYLNMLIGGGYSPGSSVTLLVLKDGVWHTVKKVEGNHYATWKTQALKWVSWDVDDSQGLDARVEIVDNGTGAEGFIVADHVVQSREDFAVPLGDLIRELEISHDYLHFPVKMDEPPRLVKLQQNGQSLREFEIQFAVGEPDFWVYLETHEFQGEKLTLLAEQRRYEPANLLQVVSAGPEPRDFDSFYKEVLRPQLHYSSPRGWNNDPNGMVYYQGEYHLFYQRNPFGWDWGNMTWGHAVSTDMVRWTNLPDALHPDASGTMFSGTAVIDRDNTAGFKTGDEDPIVLFYTSAGGTNPWSEGVPHTQSIAYSNDGGRTFTKYAGNPIIEYIREGNRDPKVLWHEPSGQWSMVLYLGEDELAFFTSSNLKDWTEHKASRIDGFHECPELFELPVDGDPDDTKWVLYGALGDYYIGTFDGKTFTPETDLIKFSHARNFYASQTFNDIPKDDGRRIQIGWARYTDLPGMPFNQMMNFPVTLTLRTTKDGIRMQPMPIREIETLYRSETRFEKDLIKPGENLLDGLRGELFDIEANIVPAGADRVGLRIGGVEIAYDAREKKLTSNKGRAEAAYGKTGYEEGPEGVSADLEPGDGLIRLRILVDRNFIEIYANDGEVFMPIETVSEVGQDNPLALFAEGGTARIESLAVRELESIWEQAESE